MNIYKTFPKDLLNPANLISLSRVPILLLMMIYYQNVVVFIVLLTLAMITDGLDGYVARKMGTTKFGAFIDPVMDKIFVGGLLIFLVFASGFSIVYLTLLLLRDIYMILVVVMFAFHEDRGVLQHNIKARWPGKLTTVGQFVALLWLVLGFPMFEYLVYIVAVLSLTAIVDYSVFIEKKIKHS